MPPRPPLGQQVHLALVRGGREAALAVSQEIGQLDLFDRVIAVSTERPAPSFLHSALCAMSLPVRRPADEHAPIIRQDGNYTLVINPKPVMDTAAGQQRLQSLGVPFGALPRLVLIHIMTEAVRTKSRHVVLGATFTDWMRRMGFRTISYGPRGSATLVREQLDRLLACEWMIRWDRESSPGEREFGIKEIKLTNEYAGVDRKNGSFMREIYMTEAFFEHLRQHAVPLNETAIQQLRDSATALDLYTWLAYRLPRINSRKPATLNWQQLAAHFGNDGTNIRKFRQTIRDAWERHVSAVYPEAKAEFDTTVIRLHASPAPLEQKLVPVTPLRLVADDNGTAPSPASVELTPKSEAQTPQKFLAALTDELGTGQARAWLKNAQLVQNEDEWVLLTDTSFIAHWLVAQFGPALDRAAVAAGVARRPNVQPRPQTP